MDRKYIEEQIITVLRGEAGAKVAVLCRKYGMSDATYYNWKAKYAGLRVSELKRLKVLEEENRRLKQIVGEQTLDIRALIEDWRRDYNEVRPHSSLKGNTPKEYAEITAGL